MYTDGRRHYSSFTVKSVSVRQVVQDGAEKVLRHLNYLSCIYVLLHYFSPFCPIMPNYSPFSRKLLIPSSAALPILQ